MLRRGGLQEMNHRERHLLLLDVDPERFPDRPRVADDVEDVVLNLKGYAQRQAVCFQRCDLRLRSA
jgi:hypothetical protein